MLEKLADIRNMGNEFEDPYVYDAIETSVRRLEAFEDVLLRDYPILGYCGCGTPENTIDTVLRAMEYCTLDTEDEDVRKVFLVEHFGTDYVSHSGIVQFLFYSLDVMGLIKHDYSLNASTLTSTGEIFLGLLSEYVESKS